MRPGKAFVVLVACVVCGCGGRTGESVGYPFDGAGVTTRAERDLFNAAEDVLVESCMRERGFAYTARPYTESKRPDPTNPYGLVKVDEARIHGYGIVEAALDPPPKNTANDDIRDKLSEDRKADWDAALLGTTEQRREVRVPGFGVLAYNENSCTRVAHEKLFGSEWDRLELTVQTAAATVVDKVGKAPEVVAATKNWENCMRGRGIEVASPEDARHKVEEALSASKDLRQVGSMELGLAQQDARCAESGELPEALAGAQTGAEQEERPRIGSTLDALKRARSEAHATAKGIVPVG